LAFSFLRCDLVITAEPVEGRPDEEEDVEECTGGNGIMNKRTAGSYMVNFKAFSNGGS